MSATRLLLDDHERHGVIPAVTDADVALRAGLAEPPRSSQKIECGRAPGLPGYLHVGKQSFRVFIAQAESDTGGSLGGVAAGQVRSRIATRETVATLGLGEEGACGGRRFVELRHEDSDAHRRMVDGLQTAGKR